MGERTREGAIEALLSSDELAARVGVKTRQSVHDWVKKDRIVGWRAPGAAMSSRRTSSTSGAGRSKVSTAWSGSSQTATPFGPG